MKTWEIDLMMLRSELLFREYAASTVEIYMKVAKDFLEYTKKDILELTKEDVIRYLDFKLMKESENTILVKLNALEFFFEEVVGIDITRNIKKYKRQESGRVVSMDEISLLLASIPKRERLLFGLMLETGEYPSEVLKYQVDDLEPRKEGWYIRGKKIQSTLAKEYLEYVERNEIEKYLFTVHGKIMHKTNVYLLLRKYTKEFLGEQMTFSDLRHAVALEMWKQGKKKEMQEYIGNQSMASIRQWYKKRGVILGD
ncbi:phage integrase N-terminal SAM-like domain-containing protein [Fusobacterium necrophorum]|uniref:tyrosine-type recombinase/integrase n=1 Tax=Fusobacterium necrophorum TaxID=859 RepID=UPI00254A5986|nr:phage integrase N-terminal SAM-like domain-containing protein [Fusobacterium necrophorum]MDK4484748.1 phage integrase N-terminal SAM-like domain-containing protein [Fusobacterium necrophorum]